MSDDDFEDACAEVLRLANLIADGTPEQIHEFADSGWWDAMDALRSVYNSWLMERT